MVEKTRQIPMSIISGFLGAGKTTFLNKVLESEKDQKFLVLVNDFGDISLDDKIVISDDVVSFSNGCICCTLVDGYIARIHELLEGSPRFDQIIVEASGISDPVIIADVAHLHPTISMSSIVTLIDASSFLKKVKDRRLKETIASQLVSANYFAISKCDVVSQVDIDEIFSWLTNYGYDQPIVTTEDSGAAIALLLSPNRETWRAQAVAHTIKGGIVEEKNTQPHSSSFVARTIWYENQFQYRGFIEKLRATSHEFLRIKGVVYFSDSPKTPYILNVVDESISLDRASSGLVDPGHKSWISFISLDGRVGDINLAEN